MKKRLSIAFLTLCTALSVIGQNPCTQFNLQTSALLNDESQLWQTPISATPGNPASCNFSSNFHKLTDFKVRTSVNQQMAFEFNAPISLHLLVYENTFDIANPCENLAFAFFDYPSGGSTEIIALSEGTDYTFVFTEAAPSNQGNNIQLSISAPVAFEIERKQIKNYRTVDSGRINTFNNSQTPEPAGVYQSTAFQINSSEDEINEIFIDGFALGTNLTEATQFNWYIYQDNNGVPAGNPEDGLNNQVWHHSSPLSSAGVTVVNNQIWLDLSAAGLSAIDFSTVGKYWLVAYPNMPQLTLGPNVLYAWYHSIGSEGVQVSPTGMLGFPTAWDATPEGRSFHFNGVFIVPATEQSIVPTADLDWNQDYCQEASLGEIQVEGQNPQWYASEESTTPLAESTMITLNTVYYLTQTIDGCESDKAPFILSNLIIVPQPPFVDEATCSNYTLSQHPSDWNNNFVWYNQATGGTPLDASTYLPAQGETLYVAALWSGNCESINRTEVSLNIIDPAAAPDYEPVQTLCFGSSLNDVQLYVAPYITWIEFVNNPIDQQWVSNTNDPIESGTYYFKVHTDCGVSGVFEVDVIISPAVQAPTGNSVQQICASTNAFVFQLSLDQPNVVWFTSNDPWATPMSSSDVVFDGFTYYAGLNEDDCLTPANDRLAVTVAFIAAPAAPTGDEYYAFCDEGTVGDLIAMGDNIQWYIDPINGPALEATETLLEGSNLYYASQQDATCEGNDFLIVTVDFFTTPEAPALATTQSLCDVESATLAEVTVDEEMDIVWYDAETEGTVLSASTEIESGVTYFAAQINGHCEGERIGITVTLNEAPSAPIVDEDQNYCNGEIVADMNVSGTGLTWFTDEELEDELPSTATLLDGGVYYVVSQANDCISETVAVQIEVTTINLTVDQNEATLTAAQTGATYQWVNCATNEVIAGEEGASFTATEDGSYAVRITLDNCTEESDCIAVVLANTKAFDGFVMEVYPNPSTGNYQIRLAESNLAYVVMDNNGRVLKSGNFESTSELLDISEMTNGIYLLKIGSSIVRLVKM